MTPAKFEQLLSLVVPYLMKESKFRQSLKRECVRVSVGKFAGDREKVHIVFQGERRAKHRKGKHLNMHAHNLSPAKKRKNSPNGVWWQT